MPIIVSKDNTLDPVNIFVIKFIGNWTWIDYEHTIEELAALLDEITGEFYQVLNFAETRWIPHGVPHRHVERGHRLGTAQMTIHIGNTDYLRLLYKATSQPFDEEKLKIVADMDAARQRIRTHSAPDTSEAKPDPASRATSDAISVVWDDVLDQAVIVKFVGKWTWNDYNSTLDQLATLIADKEGRLDQIIDFSQTEWLPFGPPHEHIERGRQMRDTTLTVYIAREDYLRQLFRVLGLSLKEDSPSIVTNIDMARQRIREHRAQEHPKPKE